jgi:hypothetical protein
MANVVECRSMRFQRVEKFLLALASVSCALFLVLYKHWTAKINTTFVEPPSFDLAAFKGAERMTNDRTVDQTTCDFLTAILIEAAIEVGRAPYPMPLWSFTVSGHELRLFSSLFVAFILLSRWFGLP